MLGQGHRVTSLNEHRYWERCAMADFDQGLRGDRCNTMWWDTIGGGR